MKILKQLILAVVPVLMLLGSNAFAGLKVDDAKVAELKKIAVVGYSFYRSGDAIFEKSSPFAFKKKVRVLAPEDPEFLVMQH